MKGLFPFLLGEELLFLLRKRVISEYFGKMNALDVEITILLL